MSHSNCKKFACGFLSVIALLMFVPSQVSALNLTSSSPPSLENHRQELDDSQEEELDTENKQKKQKRKRFSNWHQWVNLMFSPGKWIPILDYIEKIYGSLIDWKKTAVLLPDDSF